ncbi:helix-turn-helix transcriptional regulator [Candidatus Saccharibacteria bacterium]|nr:helix-turn-helix transcriptional regulator [Candidatus Saccharibacteria bacterium]
MNDDYLEKMKVVMKDAGWSQEQLAGKLGVSFASVNAWINGKSRPRSSMVKKIND